MAGKQMGQKFLSPAHFQAIRPKAASKQVSKDAAVKLLPPGEYGTAKKKDSPQKVDEHLARKEVDSLKDETVRLKDLLKQAKAREDELKEESRKYRVNLQRMRVGDAVDLRRLAELEEENAILQTEARKQKAVISKLKTDIKQTRDQHETDTEKLESDISNYVTLTRKLKQDIKEKELKYEGDIEGLKKQNKKQSVFIKELRAELKKAQEQVEIDRNGFENVITISESQKYKEIKKLEESMNHSVDKYSKEVVSLKNILAEKEKVMETVQAVIAEKDSDIRQIKEEAEEREHEYQKRIRDFTEQLKQSEDKFESTTAELQSSLQECKQSHEANMKEQAGKMEAKEKQLKEEQSLVEQLRTYIGENLPNIRLDRLQSENDELKENVITLIKENETLKSNNELLNIRLGSLNEILLIQEKELSRTQGGAVGHEGLLNRWRQKVFSLMIQMKSQEISHNRDIQEGNNMVEHLNEELDSARSEMEVVSHTLTDRNAELQITNNTCESLKRELEEARAKTTKLGSCVQMNYDIVQELYDDACNVTPMVQQQIHRLNGAFEKMTVLSQRVNFAAGRVSLLQGLLARKEAEWKSEPSKVLSENRNDKVLMDESKIANSLPYKQLLAEVDRLTTERDTLASRVSRDVEERESIAEAISEKYEERLGEATRDITQLQSEIADERERSAALGDKHELLENELKEARQTIETMKTDLARHQSAADRELDRVLGVERARFTEQFANIEKQLNEVRREHTKAVVALRQAERQVMREQEKAKEQLELQSKQSETELEKYRERMRDLDQEKNMLMATVRQEGLKLPPRGKPRPYASSADESDHNSEKETTENQRPGSRKGKSSKARIRGDRQKTTKPHSSAEGDLDAASMANVLKDLQTLSAALLTMDNDKTDKVS